MFTSFGYNITISAQDRDFYRRVLYKSSEMNYFYLFSFLQTYFGLNVYVIQMQQTSTHFLVIPRPKVMCLLTRPCSESFDDLTCSITYT